MSSIHKMGGPLDEAEDQVTSKFQKQLEDEAVQLGTQRGYLVALNNGAMNKGGHIYGGTVDPVTISERRARNKQARKSRRINRRKRK